MLPAHVGRRHNGCPPGRKITPAVKLQEPTGGPAASDLVDLDEITRREDADHHGVLATLAGGDVVGPGSMYEFRILIQRKLPSRSSLRTATCSRSQPPSAYWFAPLRMIAACP